MRAYGSWREMIGRCSNPKHTDYAQYGARGIDVCERWLSFDDFLADMGERPYRTTIDRRNNALGYSPGNCRWATATEQNRNSRQCKLTLALAKEALDSIRNGESRISVAARMGVTKAAVAALCTGGRGKNSAD